MNRIRVFVIGVLAGIAVVLPLSKLSVRTTMPEGTALLREFSFSALMAKAGEINWQVLEDRIFTSPSGSTFSSCIGRRIVATAQMGPQELEAFTTRFEQRVRDAFDQNRTVNEGFFDLVQDSWRALGNTAVRSRVNLPRRFYRFGKNHGVADIGYVSQNGSDCACLAGGMALIGRPGFTPPPNRTAGSLGAIKIQAFQNACAT